MVVMAFPLPGQIPVGALSSTTVMRSSSIAAFKKARWRAWTSCPQQYLMIFEKSAFSGRGRPRVPKKPSPSGSGYLRTRKKPIPSAVKAPGCREKPDPSAAGVSLALTMPFPSGDRGLRHR